MKKSLFCQKKIFELEQIETLTTEEMYPGQPFATMECLFCFMSAVEIVLVHKLT